MLGPDQGGTGAPAAPEDLGSVLPEQPPVVAGQASSPAPELEAAPAKPAKPPGPRRPPSMGVFISYRREDSAGHAGRLQEDLNKRFGAGSVFRDLDAIPIGSDFVEVIDAGIRRSEVVLVLVGPRWASVADDNGRRRLDDPDDFVRREVEAALLQERWVIPVLVGGARMPGESELPPSIAALARRNAVELSDLRWSRDLHPLIIDLARSRGPVRRVVDSYHRTRDLVHRLTRPRVLVPTGIVALAILIVFLVTSGGGASSEATRLDQLIPSAIQSDCTTASGSQYISNTVGVLATAECKVNATNGPQVVVYGLFDTSTDLTSTFNAWLQVIGSGPGTAYTHAAVSGQYADGSFSPNQYVIYTATAPLEMVMLEGASVSNLLPAFELGTYDPSP